MGAFNVKCLYSDMPCSNCKFCEEYADKICSICGRPILNEDEDYYYDKQGNVICEMCYIDE